MLFLFVDWLSGEVGDYPSSGLGDVDMGVWWEPSEHRLARCFKIFREEAVVGGLSGLQLLACIASLVTHHLLGLAFSKAGSVQELRQIASVFELVEAVGIIWRQDAVVVGAEVVRGDADGLVVVVGGLGHSLNHVPLSIIYGTVGGGIARHLDSEGAECCWWSALARWRMSLDEVGNGSVVVECREIEVGAGLVGGVSGKGWWARGLWFSGQRGLLVAAAGHGVKEG